MVLYLEGVVAQITISKLTAGTYFSISMVTGVAAALGMLIAMPVSAGHLNPAVTLSFVLFRRFPVQKAPGLIIGQVIH
jgi:aquaglyceroporin related protein